MMFCSSLLTSYLFSPREEEEEEEGTAGSTCAAEEDTDEDEDEKRGEDSEEVDAKRERNARRRTRALDMTLIRFICGEKESWISEQFALVMRGYLKTTKLYSNETTKEDANYPNPQK